MRTFKSHSKPFEDATEEQLDRVVDINLRGVFLATQAALKHLRKGGRIISIGSCVGERMMTPGLAAYSAMIMANLSGKTALITGVSRGIGRASALALAAAGAQVLLKLHHAAGSPNSRSVRIFLAEKALKGAAAPP